MIFLILFEEILKILWYLGHHLYGIGGFHVDKEDKYELKVEVPGIEKEKVKVKATEDSVEISGEQSKEEESEDKRKRYVYNERSYNSFYRKIPVPEEIVSSKVTAKMSNGVLHIELPKKNPTKLEEEEGTTVEIK